jgi:hypothetical protein
MAKMEVRIGWVCDDIMGSHGSHVEFLRGNVNLEDQEEDRRILLSWIIWRKVLY